MMRSVNACLAAAALALCVSGSALAAPKSAEKCDVCAAGIGKPVCCKAGVANHCAYTPCCEIGNTGFFSKTDCSTCAKHRGEAELAAQKKGAAAACSTNGYVSCAEAGNGGFFKSLSARK